VKDPTKNGGENAVGASGKIALDKEKENMMIVTLHGIHGGSMYIEADNAKTEVFACRDKFSHAPLHFVAFHGENGAHATVDLAAFDPGTTLFASTKDAKVVVVSY
jgi:hypothetical protein